MPHPAQPWGAGMTAAFPAEATRPSLWSMLGFATVVLGYSLASGRPALAVYATGFWHYGLYWLAYRHGRVSLAVFRRDAVLMKSMALAGLGLAYFSCPPDLLSLVVVGAGFALNALGARALGADRTYYGHEVAGLPHQRILVFPYSWIGHPMLVGNVLAYAGTLINQPFREQWWPLACLHVALNLGLLCMETRVMPLRGAGPVAPARGASARLLRAAWVLGGAAAGALAEAALVGLDSRLLLGSACVGACSVMLAQSLRAAYAGAPSTSGALGARQSQEAA